MPSPRLLFTDPDQFFAQCAEDPSYKGPIAVIFGMVAINAANSILQFRTLYKLFDSMGDLPSWAITGFSVFTLFFAVIGPFIGWLLWAGGFQLVSTLLGGIGPISRRLEMDPSGEFSTTLALTGWGFIPVAIGSLAGLLISYYRFQIRGVEIPENVTAETMQNFSQGLVQGPLVALSTGISMVFILVAAYYWTYAIRHARDVSRRNAAITVAVPLLISLVWQGRTLLTALGG